MRAEMDSGGRESSSMVSPSNKSYQGVLMTREERSDLPDISLLVGAQPRETWVAPLTRIQSKFQKMMYGNRRYVQRHVFGRHA